MIPYNAVPVIQLYKTNKMNVKNVQPRILKFLKKYGMVQYSFIHVY